MKALYEVTAVKNGFVTHKSFQVAKSQEEAVSLVKAYHLPYGTKYSSIRAEYVRPY